MPGHPTSPAACDRCGYDLTGLVTHNRAICPECGTPNTIEHGRVRPRAASLARYLAIIVWPVLPLGVVAARYQFLVSREIAQYGNPTNESEAMEPLLFNLGAVVAPWVIAAMIGVGLVAITRPPGPQRRRAALALLAAPPLAAALLLLPPILTRWIIG